MTQEKFMQFADSVICYRVENCSLRTYKNLMAYCENIYRDCVGFDETDNYEYFADLICTGIAHAYIAGKEENK